MLNTSVPSVNSALQRARDTLRARLPGPRHDWAPERTPTDEERELLRRFMAAWERADAAALVGMMREDVGWAMPPAPLRVEGGRIVELTNFAPELLRGFGLRQRVD